MSKDLGLPGSAAVEGLTATNATNVAPVLTVDDLDSLRHMLGVSERQPRGYRNYYVAEHGNPGMERLRAHGLVVQNERYRLSEDACYHATLKGAQFIGLKALPR